MCVRACVCVPMCACVVVSSLGPRFSSRPPDTSQITSCFVIFKCGILPSSFGIDLFWGCTPSTEVLWQPLPDRGAKETLEAKSSLRYRNTREMREKRKCHSVEYTSSKCIHQEPT